jgi:alkylated DNA repair protein (DNA oxidative demethylase)
VSVSLRLHAEFVWGGAARTDKPRRVALQHGDVVVWGGPSRLRFHGVLALKDGDHPFAGGHRINITFRKVKP